MEREQAIILLRPELDLPATSNAIEAFQNETLRPILKLQHSITLAILTNTKNFVNLSKHVNNRKQFETDLIPFIQKNIAFKNQLLGCIVGMFTLVELEFYQAHIKEINKRIITMQIQRYIDTLVEIKEY